MGRSGHRAKALSVDQKLALLHKRCEQTTTLLTSVQCVMSDCWHRLFVESNPIPVKAAMALMGKLGA